MKSTYSAGLIILVAIIGAIWYTKSDSARMAMEDSNGSYPYTCTDGAAFTMLPTEDMVKISLKSTTGMSFDEARLTQVESAGGAKYGGNGVTFSGAGEEVQIVEGGKTHICNPVPNQDEAPFNWGDAGEGAGAEQNVVGAVSESIVRSWQSTQDPMFVREFKTDGTVVDSYDGKAESTGTWTVFTKASAPAVPFTLAEGTSYVQIMMSGAEADILNFSVNALTPEALELTYMERGNTLSFKSVQ